MADASGLPAGATIAATIVLPIGRCCSTSRKIPPASRPRRRHARRVAGQVQVQNIEGVASKTSLIRIPPPSTAVLPGESAVGRGELRRHHKTPAAAP